ncbi:hypothetical protein A3A63_03735 [Candidatus Gottesmanbacteria bacterium RIFCSPLOWO2_01_FULL_46_9]|uniref:LTD domain-containing protein n=1 Tax=Candidatus Gottesmanbacteria bacterium RIFCSPLOWO2_01_FULL_46_9 TaxID=1798394 RepID=A0A1F6AZG0_9BACT|nr:MAG: hypothetical protein A3A63_03735 [Candidatus Gottesmanbacteria bacterium RIFCSPLOWO2_01_FULL_46_9]
MIYRSSPAGLTATLVAVVFFLALPFFSFGRGEVHAAVVINEVLPKTAPVTSEYIELFNNGSELVRLDRWTLENTNGEKKIFIMNASEEIPANGFRTFYQPQTGITFSISGDTVILKNEKAETVDNQSYPATLGYLTSMGRTVDGAGVWTICTSPATANKTNNCPPPPPTPTPLPTDVPTSTPVPTAPPPTPTPVADLQQVTFGQISNSDVLGESNPAPVISTPTPTPADVLNVTVPKFVLWQAAVVAVAWAILGAIAYFHKNYRRRQTKK